MISGWGQPAPLPTRELPEMVAPRPTHGTVNEEALALLANGGNDAEALALLEGHDDDMFKDVFD